MGRLCVVESLAAGPRALECRARVVEVLKGELEKGRTEGRAMREAQPLTAEGVVGAVSSVLHARLAEAPSTAAGPLSTARAGAEWGSYAELLNPLMGMIVLASLALRPTGWRSA